MRANRVILASVLTAATCMSNLGCKLITPDRTSVDYFKSKGYRLVKDEDGVDFSIKVCGDVKNGKIAGAHICECDVAGSSRDPIPIEFEKVEDEGVIHTKVFGVLKMEGDSLYATEEQIKQLHALAASSIKH